MPVPADQAIQDLFKRHFGFRPTHLTRAPAKMQLLGDFAEANDGLALTVAVDRYAYAAAAPRTDGKIELVHADRAPEVFWISDPKPNAAAPWADLFKAVLRELRQRKVHFSGFNVALHNDIPPDLALGEHSAVAVAAALTVRKLFPFSLGDSGATVPPKRGDRGELPPLPAPERLHFARVCRNALVAAHRRQEGLVDTLTSLGGKAWSALNLDCRFNSLDPTPLIGTAVILCDTGTRAADATIALAEIQEYCARAARKMGTKSLRAVEPKYLRTWQGRLEEREFACALHVTGEIQRAAAAERALREEDHRQLGNYISLSHESQRDQLHTTDPGTEQLIQLALAQRGCLGARALDHGVGATVNLVSYHDAEPFMAQLAGTYEAQTGQRLKQFVCQIVDGAA
jgi:galactokinase